ncbi:MAG: hypothetical protein ACTHMC_10070 [Pseudobacter sp.]|uniref:hypothetical protein n=1 Tax=Pseudobacter sp. TaxID=2045420 RepID=UPI003F81C38F
MDLLTCLVQTTRQQDLIRILRGYSGISVPLKELDLPCQADEVINHFHVPPSSYLINSNGAWQVIEVNSLCHLHELAERTSASLACDFLQLIYVSSVGYAYFLLYRNGAMLREIEGRGDQELPLKDFGQWMPATWKEPVHYFDLDVIRELAAGLGVDVSNLFAASPCLLLESGTLPVVISLHDKEAVERLLL